jgi:hypothetical protein
MWSTRLQQRLMRPCDKPNLYCCKIHLGFSKHQHSAPTHKPAQKIGWLVQGRAVEQEPIEIGYSSARPLHLSLWARQTDAGEILLLACSTGLPLPTLQPLCRSYSDESNRSTSRCRACRP